MYYRLYDTQTGRYMATGYNCDLSGLIDQYKSYISIDWDEEDEEFFATANNEQILSAMRINGFDIEESEIPFSESDCD